MGRDGILKKSTYSIVSVSEVTEGALEVWRGLPEIIRQDSSLAPFRQRFENLHGELHTHIKIYFLHRAYFILFL